MRIVLNQDSAEMQMSEVVRALGPAANQATARALNRAIAGVRTDSVREVRKEYSVAPAAVRKSFRVHRAKRGFLEAEAVSTGGRIPLVKFGARPSSPGKRKPRIGVSVQVKRARKVVPGSFVARMKSGHVGMFTRDGDGRLPISQKFGLSVPEMIGNDEVMARIQAGADDRFNKNLAHELDFALSKMGVR
jgi:hypothetical protein